ncbi:MAG: hypothetical protein ACHQSE_15555 [Gemmatimonadales bacterium]
MTPSQLLKPNLGDSALRLEQHRRTADEAPGDPRPASSRPDREFGGDECATLNFLKSSAPVKDWQALLHEERALTARLLRVTEARGRLEIHLRSAGHDVDALRCTPDQ